MNLLDAVDRTIGLLGLPDEAAALCEVARGIAWEIDSSPVPVPSSLWKELRCALGDIHGFVQKESDGFDRLVASLRTVSGD